jgi:hypothetical protein
MFEGLGGAQLAAAVAGTDPRGLPADVALDYALAAARVAGWAAAAEAAGLARMHATYPADGLHDQGVDHGLDPDRLAVAEIRAAYGVSQLAAGHKLGFADALGALPRLAHALRTGLLGLDPVRVLVRETEPLAADPVARRDAVDTVLDAHQADLDSGGSGLTVRQVTLRIRRAVLAADPDRAERQAERARRERRVWHQPDPAHAEGAFTLAGPVERTTECEGAVDALARAWRAAGVPGTLDQLRFDAAHHLLTTRPGTHHAHDRQTESPPTRGEDDDDDTSDARAPGFGPTSPDQWPDTGGDTRADSTADDTDETVDPRTEARTGRVPSGGWVGQVTVPLSTLLGLDDAPGEIAGVGPVPAPVARSLMAQATVWRRLLSDPADGHLITQVVRSYRPTQAMRDYVLARTGGVCSARGCGNRRGVQIDHVDAFPHGPTSGTNLDPECTPDHNGKTHGRWVHALLRGGLAQTSPLGRHYLTRPTPPVRSTGLRTRAGADADADTTAPYDGLPADLIGPDHPESATPGPGPGEAVAADMDCDGRHHDGPSGHEHRLVGADIDEYTLRCCPLTGALLPPPTDAEPTDTWSELDPCHAGPTAAPPPPDPDPDSDQQWTRVRAALLAARAAERRARARRLTAARTAADRHRAATAAQAAAYAAEAAHWQARLEAETDHALLAQLDAETLADLNTHAAAGINDPTRAPAAGLQDAA